jgi:ribosomal protein S18 acetylase RimI-like enzyme
MIEVVVNDVARREMPSVAGVLGRGYRDAPLTRAIYGDDPVQRLRAAGRVMGARVSVMNLPLLVARRGDVIIGVCGMAPPGSCQPSVAQRMRFAPVLARGGPRALKKTLQMAAEWEKYHPEERHWHLGPVAVEPGFQGKGVGGQMVARFCALVDAEREKSWLETDKAESARFFERFGFVTVDEAEVLGVPNWFMRREPAASG